MAVWSCPHCGAVQAPAARCWVCRRSSTTCSTCRHFRTSLAADVGWCALDRRRRPLTGLELRGCWSERPAGAMTVDPSTARPPIAPDPAWRDLPMRSFVAVDGPAGGPMDSPSASPADSHADPRRPPATALEVPLAAVEPPEAWDGRVSLFGDRER